MAKKVYHVYAKLSGQNPSGYFTFSFGEYLRAPGFIYKKEDKEAIGNGYKKLKSFCADIPYKRVHVLLYIHGYLGENPWFASLSGNTLHQRIYDHTKHDVSVVISLQWDSGWEYVGNRKLAFQKGLIFGNWLKDIQSVFDSLDKAVHWSFLVHSMGHIVFDGMIESGTFSKDKNRLEQVFLCAPDMPSDYFRKGYKNLPETCENVHVFHHQGDKTLQIANRFSPFRRMGIYGREDGLVFENVHDINVTNQTTDDDALGSSFSHHRYFYGSPTICNYINEWLAK